MKGQGLVFVDTGPEGSPLSYSRSKREVSRLQILVGIAQHEPAVWQQEIAMRSGDPQAVSESNTRGLVDEGMVSAIGSGSYKVTRNGIEWVLEMPRH